MKPYHVSPPLSHQQHALFGLGEGAAVDTEERAALEAGQPHITG